MEDTKIIYHIDDENTPYLVKLSVSADKVTLGDFKSALNRPCYKFFFKSVDADFGVVKEEITEDAAQLPCFNGKVIAWLVSADGSSKSDNHSSTGISDTAHHSKNAIVSKVIEHGNRGDKTNGSGKKVDAREECDTCAETDSVSSADHLPPLRNFQDYKHGSRLGKYSRGNQSIYDTSSSMLSSDLESTSFFDSEDESSRFSTATGTTMSSTRYGPRRRQRRRRRFLPISRVSEDASSYSSMTDSTMSLNIVTVTLSMETVNFLGISIVGQSNRAGDGGIYVGSIMRGGAVAQDGRIEPGDMLLEVNSISFEDMSNDDAVRVLREQVQKPGPITLVVAKCWDPNPKGYFTLSRQEPVRPIDPRAWVLHTNAMTSGQEGQGGHSAPNMGIPTANAGFPSGYPIPGSAGAGGLASLLPQSQSTLSPAASGSSVTTKSLPDSDLGGLRGSQGVHPGGGGFDKNSGGGGTVIDPTTGLPISTSDLSPLTLNSEMALVVRAMLAPDSGLEIHDRTWLKITIPNAVIGSDLVEWLYTHVDGFSDRREVRRYAANLLKFDFIQHTVNKSTFSEQCYYVFTDVNSAAFHNLNLEELDSVSEIGGGGGGASSGGRHSHASNGGESYLPSIFNQPTSVSNISASTGPSGMQPPRQQPPFWNPVGTFAQPSPAQPAGPLFSPYTQPMMFPSVSQPLPGGYRANPELHLNLDAGADQTGGVHQSCLTSEALAGMNRGSQSTSGSSGSSSSSSSSSCSAEKMISPQMKPNQSNLSTATPSNPPVPQSCNVCPAPPSQLRAIGTASVHSGSVYSQPCSCLNLLRRHSKKKNNFKKKSELAEKKISNIEAAISSSSLHPSSIEELHRYKPDEVLQNPGIPASQKRGASTTSENRSAGSGVPGAPTRLLPPRPIDPTSSSSQGGLSSSSLTLPSSANQNNSSNMATFRSPQLLQMNGNSTTNQTLLPLSARVSGGSLADLTNNSSPQPGNAAQRIN